MTSYCAVAAQKTGAKQVLFKPQRENWFYAAGAMSGDHARCTSHDSQHSNCRNGNPWIAGLDPVELAGNVPAKRYNGCTTLKHK
jgi:hypothetical protein